MGARTELQEGDLIDFADIDKQFQAMESDSKVRAAREDKRLSEEEFQEKVDETLEAVEDWISENIGKHKREQQIMEMRRRIV